MNSKALGESPSRFLRCSAAVSFGSVEVYSRTCRSEASSRGRSLDSSAVAQLELMINIVKMKESGKIQRYRIPLVDRQSERVTAHLRP